MNITREHFFSMLTAKWYHYVSTYQFAKFIERTIKSVMDDDRTVIVKKHNSANWDEKPQYFYSVYYDDPQQNWACDLVFKQLEKKLFERVEAYNGCTLHIYC